MKGEGQSRLTEVSATQHGGGGATTPGKRALLGLCARAAVGTRTPGHAAAAALVVEGKGREMEIVLINSDANSVCVDSRPPESF